MDSSLRRVRMLKEWRTWVRRIADVVKELIPNAEVYVIGSVVRGDYVGGSDVDVVVVSSSIPEDIAKRARIKVLIEERLKLPYYHPFEIHVLKPEEVSTYLRRACGYVVKLT